VEAGQEQYTIEDGIPVPKSQRRYVRYGTKYPFAEMWVGSHFKTDVARLALLKAVQRYMKMAGSAGREFAVRKHEGRWGVWRVK